MAINKETLAQGEVMKWIALILLLGFSFIAPANERVVNGVVLSCMKDGVRHYSTKIVDGCSDYRAINYQYVERILKPGEVAIYRCEGSDGKPIYRSNSGPGCNYVASYFESLTPAPARQAGATTKRVGSYTCTSDCSGHRAGHEWARSRGITDPSQCSGNSQSFIEGCRAFTEGHPGF